LGIASVADRGTLFLDEICEMDQHLQCKLLRFVETGTFYKIGSHKLEKVDIRFITATNCNLYTEVKAKRFREDFYYRLKAISITLPPLRKRGKDVLELAQYFLEQSAKKEHKSFKKFTLEAEKILLDYEWRGNIRQLRHLILNLVLLNDGEIMTANRVPDALNEEQSNNTTISESSPSKPTIAITSKNSLRTFDEIEKAVIFEAIEYCDGNVVKAAKGLRVGYSTIYHKLKKWGVPIKRLKKHLK